MRERLENLRRRLQDGDEAVCGGAPRWIVEIAAENLREMLGQVQCEIDAETARLIALSLVKTIRDSPICEEDCKDLLDAVGEFGGW